MEIKMEINATKQQTIKTPDNMDGQVAQQCFFIGLKNLIYLNNGNVLMSYFQDGKIKTSAIRGQTGQVMIKFLKAVEETEKFASLQDKVQTGETKKQYLQNTGNKILNDLANYIKQKKK